MANICSNSTVFYGKREFLDALWGVIQNAQEREHPMWLGNIFIEAGFPEKEISDGDIYCRGSVDFLSRDERDGSIKIDYQTAWSPIYEEFDKLLNRFFPDVEEVTIAEECGCEIFINTDVEGRWFKDRYQIEREDSDTEYFDDLDSFLRRFNEIFGTSFGTFAECEAYEPADDSWVSVHEYADR